MRFWRLWERLGCEHEDTVSQKEHLGIDQRCNKEILLSVTVMYVI